MGLEGERRYARESIRNRGIVFLQTGCQTAPATFPVTNFGDFITCRLILHACKKLPSHPCFHSPGKGIYLAYFAMYTNFSCGCVVLAKFSGANMLHSATTG